MTKQLAKAIRERLQCNWTADLQWHHWSLGVFMTWSSAGYRTYGHSVVLGAYIGPLRLSVWACWAPAREARS